MSLTFVFPTPNLDLITCSSYVSLSILPSCLLPLMFSRLSIHCVHCFPPAASLAGLEYRCLRSTRHAAGFRFTFSVDLAHLLFAAPPLLTFLVVLFRVSSCLFPSPPFRLSRQCFDCDFECDCPGPGLAAVGCLPSLGGPCLGAPRVPHPGPAFPYPPSPGALPSSVMNFGISCSLFVA